MSESRPEARPDVSVVVPVYDEEAELPDLLDDLASRPGDFEVVVVDGGSTDATRRIAQDHPLGVRLVDSRQGRAHQLNAGAGLAQGAVLLFLHADTRLPGDAIPQVMAAVERGVDGGNFDLVFDGRDRFSRVNERVRRFERRHGIYYGDSAIFCRREVFTALGGYRPLSIMEDYDFARRLERTHHTTCLPVPVVTSARRWRERGVVRTIAVWSTIRWLYLAGVPADRLARLYRHVR